MGGWWRAWRKRFRALGALALSAGLSRLRSEAAVRRIRHGLFHSARLRRVARRPSGVLLVRPLVLLPLTGLTLSRLRRWPGTSWPGCGLRCSWFCLLWPGCWFGFWLWSVMVSSLTAHRRVSTPPRAVAMRVPRRRIRVAAAFASTARGGCARMGSACAPLCDNSGTSISRFTSSAVSLQGLPLFLITSTLDGPDLRHGLARWRSEPAWASGSKRGHAVIHITTRTPCATPSSTSATPVPDCSSPSTVTEGMAPPVRTMSMR